MPDASGNGVTGNPIADLAIVLALILVGGFFAASEIALITVKRHRLNQLIETELPHVVSRGQNFNDKFRKAYPDLSPEGKKLFATVRGLTEHDAFESNKRIRRWIEEHPLDTTLHDRQGFDCGVPALNEYLQRFAEAKVGEM